MYPTPRSVRRWALVAAVPLAVALAAPAATSGAAENAPADDPVATARRIMNGTQVDNTINSVPPGAPTMGDCFGTYVSSDPAVIYADPNDEYTFGTGGDDILTGTGVQFCGRWRRVLRDDRHHTRQRPRVRQERPTRQRSGRDCQRRGP